MTTRLDLDDGGTPQAQRGVGGHRVALDLVAVEPQDLEPGVIHHVHHGAEAADGELCGEKETQRCQGAASPCRDGQGIDASAPKFQIIPAKAGSASFWRSC